MSKHVEWRATHTLYLVIVVAAYLGSLLGYRAGGKRMAKDLAALERIVQRTMARATKV